jgi:hypothetical protein
VDFGYNNFRVKITVNFRFSGGLMVFGLKD